MKIRYLILTASVGIIFFSSAWHSDKRNLKIHFGVYTDPRDNHRYQTVKIGEQEWMAENFAYLPYVCPVDSVECGVWVYNYSGTDISDAKETLEYKKFGGLYSWKSALELAPEGWHLPSDKEWKELERHLGIADSDIDSKTWRGKSNEANRLKEKGDTGLKVTFGGWKTDYGKFNFIEEHANFWCSTEVDKGRGFERLIGVNNGKIGKAAGNKGCGFSVRYIKN
ncbi:major paralogous domain-containing protein [Marivirga sericea]|uniref:Major paralogous domain-containing protein n=1 Tax=Marivirga sericea TaxID=1028 RepID=A0A1X7KZN9_9BACT|nr:fibrobacter succinogenes major paralogous domain-containing protein [Marivirga sericea]SMG46880.1 major paralogous domain-containing protein [Marivirga sericea]